MRLAIVVLLLNIQFLPQQSFSCSAFTYTKNGQIILAANTDACEPVDGLIIVNKRNISKRGSDLSTSGQYASWVSKYGSITFTYCCREVAQYGMNEAGLVISTVGLPGSKSPVADERPPLDGNIWAQYILDNCTSVAEVMKVEQTINIVNSKDQYLICDRNGQSLIVECLAGKMVYFFGESLPVAVLTNETYANCLLNSDNSHLPVLDPFISNRRFQSGEKMIMDNKTVSDEQVLQFSFDVLDSMAQTPCTQWNIVFDIKYRRVYFRTKQAAAIRYFNLKDFDFSCQDTMLELDVGLDYEGNVLDKFTTYSRINNLNLMKRAFQRFGIFRTEEQFMQIIEFFDSFKCLK